MRFFYLPVILLMVSAVHGATYYVSPSGSGTACSSQSPCSLDQGLKTVGKPGDVLIFKDGIYNRTTSPVFKIIKGGDSSGYITYRAEHSRKAVISSAPGCRGIRISADWVKLEGIKLVGNKSGAINGGIKIGAADEWTPDKYRKFHDIIVDDCELYKVGNSGFHITTGEYNIEVKNCYINGTQYHSWWGSAFYTGNKYDPKYTVHDVKIHDNVLTDISQNAVDVKKYAYNMRIYNNTISKMILCSEDRPGISGCQPNEGIFNLNGHDNWAYNNIATAAKNGMGIVVIMGDANNRIFNNVFYNMTAATATCSLVYRITWDTPAETGLDSYVYNNTFYNCRAATKVTNGDDRKLRVKNNVGLDYPDNVQASAISSTMFMAAGNGDFRLTSVATPMIDTVTIEPFSSTDREGVAIVGLRRDRGAYEYKRNVPPSAPSGLRLLAVN